MAPPHSGQVAAAVPQVVPAVGAVSVVPRIGRGVGHARRDDNQVSGHDPPRATATRLHLLAATPRRHKKPRGGSPRRLRVVPSDPMRPAVAKPRPIGYNLIIRMNG